jgi:hypothetical protein
LVTGRKNVQFYGRTATMRRRCEDRKCFGSLARLIDERWSVFDEVSLEVPLNVKCDKVTEETRRTGE